MTGNDIMITLRRCADRACYLCTEKGKGYCQETIASLAWDLIYRQKAEIERLQEQIESLNKAFPCVVSVGNNCMVYARSLEDYDNLIGDISAEGIEEFCARIERVLFLHPAQRRYYDEIKKEFIKETENGQ